MLKSEIHNDPVRKQKLTAKLTEEWRKKILLFCLYWFCFFFRPSMSLLISSVLSFEGELPCHTWLI